MLKLLFENEDLKINYHKSENNNTVVIVFNPLEWRAKDGDVWGYSVLSRSGYSIVGITSKEKSWFPEESIYQALSSIFPVLRRYNIRLTYGYSMGGYAALRYSRVLGASHVLSFSPQSTIAPSDLNNGDKRYLQYYSHEQHINMKVTEPDVSGKAYIIYDKGFNLDSYQVDIMNLAHAKTLDLPRTGHGSIRVLAKSKSLLDVIGYVLNDDDGTLIRNKLIPYRKYISEYYESMMALASKGLRWRLIDNLYSRAIKLDLATIAVKRKYAELLSRQKRYDEAILVLTDKSNKDVCNQKANYLISAKRFKEAVEVLSGVVKNSDNLHFSRTLARAYELSGDPNSAVEVLEPFEFSNSKNPDYLCHFGRLLSLSGQESRGKRLCKLASDLRPSEPYFMNIYKNLG